MITIVDFGLGNVQAFTNIFQRLKIPVVAAKTAAQLASAEKIVLPGVGAFDWAMVRLAESGMRRCLDELVMTKKRPVLGVCVGAQMMARRSEEGRLPGLAWINAEVRRFEERGFHQDTHLPHMGWNDAAPTNGDSLFKGMSEPRFYFLHSYYLVLENPSEILATTDYNGPFVSAVRSSNVFGTQFHPEKSHQWGIQLLKNFAEL